MGDEAGREKRPRRYFSPEFKARTVELIRESGKSIPEVCRDLDLLSTYGQEGLVLSGHGRTARGSHCTRLLLMGHSGGSRT